MADFIRDWLRRDAGPASDLDLVVLLLNSLDLLSDPPDRLADIGWFRAVLAEVGRADLGDALAPADLTGLLGLRESLRAIFAAKSADEAAALLNPMLRDAVAIPQLVVSGDDVYTRARTRRYCCTACNDRAASLEDRGGRPRLRCHVRLVAGEL